MRNEPYDLLDADQPIPLGTAATRPEAPAVQSAVELKPAVEMPSLAPAAVAAEPEVVPAMASMTLAAALSPETPPVASRPPADPTAQPDVHPMAGLRSFRLEPIPVEPAHGGRRDLVRFLVQFALVMAFVYALIVAFVLLVAHVRGTPA